MMNTRSDLACKTSKAGVKNSVPPKSTSSKHADSPLHSILFLHKTVGNQAVEKLIRSGVIQAKPTIGKPMDEKAVRASDTLGDKPNVTPSKSQIRRMRNGEPMPARALFEPRFGQEFGQVRLHTDTLACESATRVNALAYTVGADVVFGRGQYSPKTPAGKTLIAPELAHVVQQKNRSSQHISRKISVMNFDTPIPNPGGTGINQTKEEAIFDYVTTLCPDADYMAAGGSISLLDDSFCVPSVLTADGLSSKAELSNTATSCTCLCDTMLAPDDIKIDVDDLAPSNTRFEDGGGTVRVPSPNNKNIPKVQGVSGKMVDSPPFIVFAHELCGHYWLNMQGVDERENEALRAMGRDGHDPAIRREDLIRQEHGLEERGLFRDPCCGIGNPTAEDLKKSSGRCGEQFEKQKNIKDTLANECKHWRDEYNKLNGTNFTTDDVIPEKEAEKVPAKWRIEVFFKKDAPQPWNTLDQSLAEGGRDALELAIAIANKHKEMNLQLSGNASSDKAPGDPTYNKRLAKRRAQFVLAELMKRGIDKQRFQTFDSDCDKIQEGVHNCGDEQSEAKSNEKDRNVEIKIVNP